MSNKKSTTLRRAAERIFKQYQIARTKRWGFDGTKPFEKIQRLARHIDYEPKLRVVIDQAFRQWITTGVWPMMEHEHAWYISERLGSALDIASILELHGWTCPRKSENDILDFLLIACWTAYGTKAQKAHLIELRKTT
jgi:hypothetical protein